MSPIQAVICRTEELRAFNGMSLFILAKASDLPQSTVKDLMRGEHRNVSLLTLIKIATGLGVSLRDFFDSDFFDLIDSEYL